MQMDFTKTYAEHRERVKKMSAEIDNRAPALNGRIFMRRVREDFHSFNNIMDKNLDLLQSINMILCTKRMHSFRPESPVRNCNLTHEEDMIRKLEEENRDLGNRILGAKTVTSTWHSKQLLKHADWHLRRHQRDVFVYPKEIMEKYDMDIPDTLSKTQILLRPTIYLYVGLKDVRPLGRLFIELYTEASPQVVLEFVKFSAQGNPKNLRFKRLFPRLWLEGELKLQKDTMLKDKFEYDYRALDHNSGPGILAYSLKYLKPLQRPVLNFSISFKPLNTLNRKRIAFGRVTHGEYLLDILQDYGTKNGKPVREVVCYSCGIEKRKPKTARPPGETVACGGGENENTIVKSLAGLSFKSEREREQSTTEEANKRKNECNRCSSIKNTLPQL